jgi:hypothetical protein
MEYLDNLITRQAYKCTAISPSGGVSPSGSITVDSDIITVDSDIITVDNT